MTVRPFQRAEPIEKPVELGDHPIVVDTSVFIDGRILSIVNSGFLTGTLVVPNFILLELQHIADDADSLRRMKGRRGLDVVNKLKGQRNNPWLKVVMVKDDPLLTKEVDSKLVVLAKKMGSSASYHGFQSGTYCARTKCSGYQCHGFSTSAKGCTHDGRRVCGEDYS